MVGVADISLMTRCTCLITVVSVVAAAHAIAAQRVNVKGRSASKLFLCVIKVTVKLFFYVIKPVDA